MKAEQVDTALRQKFISEDERLVFWHDPNGEFADYVGDGLTSDEDEDEGDRSDRGEREDCDRALRDAVPQRRMKRAREFGSRPARPKGDPSPGLRSADGVRLERSLRHSAAAVACLGSG